MTAPASPGSTLVERARRGLATDRAGHVAGLVAACRQALAARDSRLAWLLADRLCRVTGGSQATPWLLRSAASAFLGDAPAAHRDLERAIAVNPEQPDVLEAMLRSADPARRKAAARRLAPREEALAALAESGVQGFLRFRQADGVLSGEGFWTGASRLDLGLTHSEGALSIAIEGQQIRGGPFGWHGRVELPWPARARAMAISCEAPGIELEPALLRALPGTPPASRRALPPTEAPDLMIIVPVHGDPEATRTCFDFLGALTPSGYRLRIVAVDDASPHAGITALLDRLAAEGRITLLRHRFNLGFAAAVNHALDLREPGEDVLLLNADAYLPQGALETLRAVALAAPENGTVTPFSNNGEDMSLPRRFTVNALPGPDRIRRLDALARQVNGVHAEEIPNGVGFCLYIRAPLLEAVGGFSHGYERGYFEDVDFCLRARGAGFRNLCATGAYVGHSGSLSFAGEKRALVRRNLARIHANFPEYRDLADAFAATDPLAEAAMRIVAADLPALGKSRLIVASDEVPDRVLAEIVRALPAAPMPVLALRVAPLPSGRRGLELSGLDDGFPARLSGSGRDGEDPDWLAALRPEEVIFVDPAILPPGLGADLVRRIPRRAIALSDHAMAGAPLPEWCPSSPVRLVTSAAMARLVAQQGPDIRPLRPRNGPGRPPPVGRGAPAEPGLLAVIPGQNPARLMHFLEESASLLRGEGISLVVVGAFEGDLALFDHAGLWLSGAIETEDIPAWLAQLGIRHCLFTDRHHGLADPLTELLHRHGIRTACFGPPEDDPTGDLRLDGRISGLELASALGRWLIAAD